MTTLQESQEQRDNASYGLLGSTPRARRLSAQILVSIAYDQDRDIDQWVVDVAEGRLPA